LKINIENFKELLDKATLHYTAPYVGVSTSKDKVHVGLKGDNFIVIVDKPNDIFTDVADDFEMFFEEPNQQLKPYLDLMNGIDNVKVTVHGSTRMILEAEGQKSIIHFCAKNRIPYFAGDGPKAKGSVIYDVKVDDDLIYKFDKIKSVGSRFKKVYITVQSKKVSIEATDKTNQYSNGLVLSLCDTDQDNCELCFESKTLYSVFKLVEAEYSEFKMAVQFDYERKSGLISFIKSDNSEKYYIISSAE